MAEDQDMDEENFDLGDEDSDPELSDLDEEAREAFVAFRNAKGKYKAALKERGLAPRKVD